MKRRISSIAAALGALLCSAFPDLNYQALVVGASGSPIASAKVDVAVTITGNDGTAVYTEKITGTTDNEGILAVTIGEGDALDGIDWTVGGYSLTTLVTTADGVSMTASAPLLSVPSALLAGVAETVSTVNGNGRTVRLVIDDYGVVEPVEFPAGYSRLVFYDSFNGTGLPDADKWSFEKGFMRNSELQYYTEGRVENAFQQDGALHLRCINEKLYDDDGNVLNEATHKDGSKTYITSASIHTKRKAFWKYCYLEARIKVPVASGTWPAVWMVSENNEYGYWPRSGEIDIMEFVGNESPYYNCALHYLNGSKGNKKQVPDVGEWHTVAIDWTPDRIDWFIDGKRLNRAANPHTNWGDWPFDKEFYLILNFAFGGGWGGRAGIDLNALPLDYEVDYVRVFQK